MKRLVKLLTAVAVLLVFGYLFMRSVQDTQSAPYTMQGAHFDGWAVTVETAATPSAPVLSLRPPRDIAAGVFRQLFQRAAESMNGPATPSVALLLRDEFDATFGGTTLDALATAAREAGLERAQFVPRCMALRRQSAPGVTRQLYFVVLDSPAFVQFRQGLARMATQTGFDPAALSPVLFVAASDAAFASWLPLRVDGQSECVAPIALESP